MEYARGSQVYEGQFVDGKLVVNGCEYTSLSAAATAVAVTKNGQKTILNGWFYWKVQFPEETQWRSLQEMRSGRKRYRIYEAGFNKYGDVEQLYKGATR